MADTGGHTVKREVPVPHLIHERSLLIQLVEDRDSGRGVSGSDSAGSLGAGVVEVFNLGVRQTALATPFEKDFNCLVG